MPNTISGSRLLSRASIILLALLLYTADGSQAQPSKPAGQTGVKTLIPGQLTVCTYGGFAPVCYKDKDQKLVGYDVSFLARFAESLGLKVVVLEKPFNDIWT